MFWPGNVFLPVILFGHDRRCLLAAVGVSAYHRSFSGKLRLRRAFLVVDF